MVAPGRYDFRRHVYGRPDSPPPFNIYRAREESEALDLAEQCEQNSAWFDRQSKLHQSLKDLAELALALAGVGAVVLGLWFAKAWGYRCEIHRTYEPNDTA